MLHELTCPPATAEPRCLAVKRRWRCVGASLALSAALIGLAGNCTANDASAIAPLAVKEVAAGVYVHAGAQEDVSSANHGDVANIGFIIGERCVAVIDTGGSIAVGQALRASIRGLTKLPVCYVINTHVHPDHIFGNAAFRGDNPTFVGNARLAAAMAGRGQNYLRALVREVGASAADSEVIAPGLEVVDRLDLDLGGRVLKLTAWKTAHTDNDLTVFDPKTETLWLSDLLFVDRVPVVDGSLRGWLTAMADLRQMNPRHVVPGHGGMDSPWPQILEPQQRYLSTLAADIRRALAERLTIQQTVETAGNSERSNWLLFDSFHRRNVAAAFAELEWED